MLVSQGIGLLGTFVFLGVSGEVFPAASSIAWAAAAGASGVIGVGFFYYALSRGTMGIIAPLAALIGAGVPVFVAIVGGEAVSTLRLAGIVVALLAVVLISLPGGERSGDERRRLRIDIAELPLVFVSGLGFAGFFLFIDRASADGGTWWPLTVVRLVGLSIVMLAALVAAARLHGSMRRRASGVLGLDRLRARSMSPYAIAALFLLAGAGDLGGNTFFLLARQADAFSVAVVLSSLYPVVTTVMAAVLLHERLRPLQILGVVLATVSVPLLR